jgi:leucyl-tRNA---protein transferase
LPMRRPALIARPVFPSGLPPRNSSLRALCKGCGKKNQDLSIEVRPAKATQEQFVLFTSYQNTRHAQGDMSGMAFSDYRSMIEETPVDTNVVEFRDQDEKLLGVCLVDHLESGISAVYSFFDHVPAKRSLGTFILLWLIEWAWALGGDYLYLGFWIKGCSKMSYKARFRPFEVYTPEGWREDDERIGESS